MLQVRRPKWHLETSSRAAGVFNSLEFVDEKMLATLPRNVDEKILATLMENVDEKMLTTHLKNVDEKMLQHFMKMLTKKCW
jgi:hypothetical protein